MSLLQRQPYQESTFQLLQPLSSRPRKTTCVTADHVRPNNFPIYRAIFWFYCAINVIYRAIKKIWLSSLGHRIPTLRPLARFARGLREVTPMRGLMTHSYSSAPSVLRFLTYSLSYRILTFEIQLENTLSHDEGDNPEWCQTPQKLWSGADISWYNMWSTDKSTLASSTRNDAHNGQYVFVHYTSVVRHSHQWGL